MFSLGKQGIAVPTLQNWLVGVFPNPPKMLRPASGAEFDFSQSVCTLAVLAILLLTALPCSLL